MGEHFGVSELVAGLTVCVFVVGFGLGPLLLSPLSEMYGRKIVCTFRSSPLPPYLWLTPLALLLVSG